MKKYWKVMALKTEPWGTLDNTHKKMQWGYTRLPPGYITVKPLSTIRDKIHRLEKWDKIEDNLENMYVISEHSIITKQVTPSNPAHFGGHNRFMAFWTLGLQLKLDFP
jgi:hypothetical protein